MRVKQYLYLQCELFVCKRIATIENTIQDLQKSLLNETKSTAGDKHETGRAMLQLEREKAGNQLAEAERVKRALFKINVETTSEIISLGTVVYTSKSNYFIAISAGEITLNDRTFFAISPATPIAKTLFSKQVGDEIEFRNTTFTILAIV